MQLTRRQRETFRELSKIYGSAYNSGNRDIQRTFGTYSGPRHFENRARWRESARNIQFYCQPSEVLDLGCGRGSLVNELRDLGVPAWGIDIGEDVRTAWGIVANACELPVNRSFDTVTALDIIEHVPWDVQKHLFSELRRATRRLLVVTVPTEAPHHRHTSAVPARNHYLSLPSDEWKGLFEREGFSVISAGDELAPLGLPFSLGETNYPFCLRRNV